MINLTEHAPNSVTLDQGQVWCSFQAWEEMVTFAEAYWNLAEDANLKQAIAPRVINAIHHHFNSPYYLGSAWFQAQRVHDVPTLAAVCLDGSEPFVLRQPLTLLQDGCALASHTEVTVPDEYYARRITEEVSLDFVLRR